jgi:hypothetical protein
LPVPSSVQLALGVKPPFVVGFTVKETDPVGVLEVPPSLSATVTEHVLALLALTGLVQVTVVVVVRVLTVTDVVLLLLRCVASPP